MFKRGWYHAEPYRQAHFFADGRNALCGAVLHIEGKLKAPRDRVKCSVCQNRTGDK